LITIILPFSVNALQGAITGYASVPVLSIEAVVPEEQSGAQGIRPYKLTVRYETRRSESTTYSLSRVVNIVFKGETGPYAAPVGGSAPQDVPFYCTPAHGPSAQMPHTLARADGVVRQPTAPLAAGIPNVLWIGSENPKYERKRRCPLGDRNPKSARPQVAWTASHCRLALTALADLHATRWGRPPDPSEHAWVSTPLGHDAEVWVRRSRAALDQIERADWGGKFFTKERLHAWMRALDEPSCLLGLLRDMPQTLIYGDSHPFWILDFGFWSVQSKIQNPKSKIQNRMVAGPAPYDFAGFCSSARWWFGQVPLSLAEMRNHYLERLNSRLDQPLDRYLFDAATDAARAWRFAAFWPPFILDHHTSLLAGLHHLQATIVEPAFASLRRCTG
jgi:hypothetical protein